MISPIKEEVNSADDHNNFTSLRIGPERHFCQLHLLFSQAGDEGIIASDREETLVKRQNKIA
jgi:hypothetical protein